MLNRNSSGIYKIVNNITGKIYIGSAKYLIKRCLDHRRNLVNNVHKNKYLQRSWNFYGWQAFEFLLVELVEDTSKLLEREQYWIDTLNTINPNRYNASPIAGSKLGFRHSEESKARMKISRNKRITDKDFGLQFRKLDLWPHADGWKCKCDDCLTVKRLRWPKAYA